MLVEKYGDYAIHVKLEAPDGAKVWDLILYALDSDGNEVLSHKFDFVNITELLSDRNRHPYRDAFIAMLDTL